MTRFSDIAPIGNLARTNDTDNTDNQPNDHNTFQQKLDAAVAAGVLTDADAAALTARVASLEGSSVLSMKERLAGMYVPPQSLEHWLFTLDGVRRAVEMGDSTREQTTGSCSFGQGGRGTVAERKSVALARDGWGPCISPGVRPIWYSGNAWTGAGKWGSAAGYVEWTIAGGTPQAQNPTRVGAGDVAPFGRCVSMATRNDIVQWTKPTLGPVGWWGRPIVGFEVLYIDDAVGVPLNVSYSADGGAFTNFTIDRLGDNKLKTVYVTKNVNSFVQFRGARADNSNSPWTIVTVRPYWVHPFLGGNPADGFYIDNIAHDSNFLSSFVNSASAGDPLAILNNVVNPAGTPGLTPPPLLGWLSFTNDQSFALTSAWQNNLTAVNSRMLAGGGDLVHISCYEQISRGGSDVLTNYGGRLEYSNQHDYRASSKAWAATNKVAYLDLDEAWAARGYVGQAGINPYLANSLHPSQEGIDDEASRERLMLVLHS